MFANGKVQTHGSLILIHTHKSCFKLTASETCLSLVCDIPMVHQFLAQKLVQNLDQLYRRPEGCDTDPTQYLTLKEPHHCY